MLKSGIKHKRDIRNNFTHVLPVLIIGLYRNECHHFQQKNCDWELTEIIVGHKDVCLKYCINRIKNSWINQWLNQSILWTNLGWDCQIFCGIYPKTPKTQDSLLKYKSGTPKSPFLRKFKGGTPTLSPTPSPSHSILPSPLPISSVPKM